MLDLIIKDGVDLTGEPIEIGVKSGKIVVISEEIHDPSKSEISAQEAIVSAGWIDSHVHCYEKMNLYYDFPDEIRIKKGVTTVIDAGTAGENNIGDFYQLAKKAKTNVLAMMNISENGIVHQDGLADLSKINQEKNLKELQGFIYRDNVKVISDRIPYEVLDRIGTGDAFVASILTGIIENWPLEKTVEFATYHAVLAHTTMGDSPALPKEFVLNYMKNKVDVIR